MFDTFRQLAGECIVQLTGGTWKQLEPLRLDLPATITETWRGIVLL